MSHISIHRHARNPRSLEMEGMPVRASRGEYRKIRNRQRCLVFDVAVLMRDDPTVADAALYFPYIEVPDSPALARVLLYWDELGSIIPAAFAFGVRTRDLTDTGLVRPIDPMRYWAELDELTYRFLQLVEDQRLAPPIVAPAGIHLDKATRDLWYELEDRGLVQSRHGSWMMVDGRAAALYMVLLAGALSRALNMEPITDQRNFFREPAAGGSPHDTAQLFDRMRGAVLRDVLPAPLEPVAPRELASFKEKHWDLLRSFRRYVESELIACARERDAELRRRMLEQVQNDISDSVDEITSRLRARHWRPGVGLLCVAIAGAPAVAETVVTGSPFPASSAAAAPLAEIVRNALSAGRTPSPNAPLAYAALARDAFA